MAWSVSSTDSSVGEYLTRPGYDWQSRRRCEIARVSLQQLAGGDRPCTCTLWCGRGSHRCSSLPPVRGARSSGRLTDLLRLGNGPIRRSGGDLAHRAPARAQAAGEPGVRSCALRWRPKSAVLRVPRLASPPLGDSRTRHPRTIHSDQRGSAMRCAPACSRAVTRRTRSHRGRCIGRSRALPGSIQSYRYEKDGGVTVLDPLDGPSVVELPCRISGGDAPSRLPKVAWRAGVDLHPIDVRDPDALSWLETLVWPEHDARRTRLHAQPPCSARSHRSWWRATLSTRFRTSSLKPLLAATLSCSTALCSPT